MSKKETVPAGNTLNMLSNGTIVMGSIQSEDDIRIDGAIEGNLNCKGKVIVGHTGRIKGNVICTVLDLMGAIEGNIKTTDVAILRSTAVMTGNIETDVLEVEPGAHIICERIITKTSTLKAKPDMATIED